jgi:ribosomal-protein-alanine N-acetyltransferase
LAILPELVTPRLVLRRLELDDASFLVRLLNEPSFLENIGDRGVRDAQDAHRYLRDGPMAMYAKYGFGLWHVALKTDGTAIGMCGLLKRETLPDPDLGYAYLPQHWGNGYALEAAEATLRHGAGKFGLRRVIAVVSQGNAGSIRVLEKIGMRFERMHSMDPGKADVRLYGRALESTDA